MTGAFVPRFEQQPGDSARAQRRVDGQVLRATKTAPQPVANQWVILHRVGNDRAAPLDSTRTGAEGRFNFRYRMFGDSSAIYFVSTSYGGVAYFSAPLREPVVRGEPAQLIVYDTTSTPVPIAVAGRHVIVGTPQPNGRRPIGEVYDLDNSSTVTLVARDSVTPVWTAHLPPHAVSFQLNTSGSIAAGAVSQRGSTVQLFAPLSPGIRQFAFTYELPVGAFPLALPAERETGVFELLVQEPTARVGASGAALREVAPVSPDGRLFRRFLARDIGATSIVNVDVPPLPGASPEKVYLGVTVMLLVAMTIALVFAARRSMPRFAFAGAPQVARLSTTERLVRSIAQLDEEFERSPMRTDEAARREYETKRAALKSDLSKELAAGQRRA